MKVLVSQVEKKMCYDEFEGSLGDWAPHFRPFIEGEKMYDIYQRIKKDAERERILPTSDNTYRAFKTTRYGQVKVIFYLMDPYPRVYKGGIPQATGIAMDCSNSPDGKIQPSLEKWYDAIEDSYQKPITRDPSLEYLHEQGVMMLNTDLTCKKDKTASHEGLWEPFQAYFLREVMYGTVGVVYVLCGKSSQRMKKYINPLGNYIIELEHPAAASHKQTMWKYDNIFKRINTLLKDDGKFEIMWDSTDWHTYSDPPF